MSKLVKNTVLYSVGNILPQAAAIILLPIYTKYLSPEEYGIVNAMQVLTTILIIIFTLAIERSIYRLYYDYQTEGGRREFLGSISIVIYVFSTTVLAVLFLMPSIVASLFKAIPFYPFYAYAILSAYASIFSLIPKTYWQVREEAWKFLSFSLLQFVLSTSIVLYFVVATKSGAAGMLLGQMMSNVILVPFLLYFNIRFIELKLKLKIIKACLLFSIPMIPSLLSAWVINLSDRVFIERYFTLDEVGIYSLAYRISAVITIVAGAISMAYNPIFYRIANSEDQDKARVQLSSYNKAIMVAIILFAFFVSFFAKEAVLLFLNPRYHRAYYVVPILVSSFAINQLSSLFSLSIYQVKRSALVMSLILISAIINILCNMLLIPVYGMWGASFSALFTFTSLTLLNYWFGKKCYYIPLQWLPLAGTTAICITLVVLFQFLPLATKVSLVIKSMLIITVGLWFTLKYRKFIYGLFYYKSMQHIK